MPTLNDLSTAHDEYRDHPNDETIRVLCVKIRSYARRLATSYKYFDPDEAADSILALAWACLAQFKGESTFGTWLHTLARRRLMDMMRADRRRPVVQLDERREPEAPVTHTPLMDVCALTHLSDDERYLVQRLIEQPDYDDLAQSLCISPVALRSRLERILAKGEQARAA